MNGEDMVRALGFIDEKYIDEAETAKLSTKGVWLRMGSAAACLCLFLAGIYGLKQSSIPAEDVQEMAQAPAGGWQENAVEDSSDAVRGQKDMISEEIAAEGAEPKAYMVSTQEIRTDGGSEDIVYPLVTVLRSREELEDYCRAQRDIFDLESGFLDACKGYDSSYFAQNDLILICVEENSGSVTHQVTDVCEENGGWVITVVRHEPEEKTDDLAQWHILVEVQMGKVIALESAVTIRLENKEN